ncbi:MAG: rhodanese-like domain-containing protein, partial [Calditrichaeota bacterium]|nr:rhodanese-like domain-containing protein [Calditrichota bacterium]
MSEPRVSGRSSWTRDALGALGILALATVLGLVVNAFHPRAVSFRNPGLPASRAVGSGAETAVGVEAGPRVIPADTLQAWLAKGKCVLLDAREPGAYAAGHIPGARNLPLDFVADSAAVLQHLPKDVWLVCYCDGPPCDLGE